MSVGATGPPHGLPAVLRLWVCVCSTDNPILNPRGSARVTPQVSAHGPGGAAGVCRGGAGGGGGGGRADLPVRRRKAPKGRPKGIVPVDEGSAGNFELIREHELQLAALGVRLGAARRRVGVGVDPFADRARLSGPCGRRRGPEQEQQREEGAQAAHVVCKKTRRSGAGPEAATSGRSLEVEAADFLGGFGEFGWGGDVAQAIC